MKIKIFSELLDKITLLKRNLLTFQAQGSGVLCFTLNLVTNQSKIILSLYIIPFALCNFSVMFDGILDCSVEICSLN